MSLNPALDQQGVETLCNHIGILYGTEHASAFPPGPIPPARSVGSYPSRERDIRRREERILSKPFDLASEWLLLSYGSDFLWHVSGLNEGCAFTLMHSLVFFSWNMPMTTCSGRALHVSRNYSCCIAWDLFHCFSVVYNSFDNVKLLGYNVLYTLSTYHVGYITH